MAGLVGLWRTRRRLVEGAGGPLVGALLAGFGLWHFVDSVLSHWVLGIHRIRLDSPNPLAWDLLWFVVFGVLPMAVGWLLVRGGGPRRGPGRPTVALLALTAVTNGVAAWSLRPPPDQPFTTVVFRPGLGPPQVFAALAATDARLVWSDPAMGVVVVEVAPERRWGFYGRGALLVGGSGVPAVCLGWSRA